MKKETTSEKLSAWLLNRKVQLGILLLLIVLNFFVNLGQAEITIMEARNFITAREISESGHWLVPTMNGHLRLAKPPLPTWITAFSGTMAGDIENIAALRFPAAVMAGLLVLFVFAYARQLTTNKLIPFLAAAILATSYSMVNLGRQGTWDIYCHSFMMGGIWLLAKGYNGTKTRYGLFAAGGILLGFSFLSKGPVSFYALLLPFVISYCYTYGFELFRRHKRGLLVAVILCVMVSVSWPLYIYTVVPDALKATVSGESSAWASRHVQPIWYYWSFPAQAGVWAFIALAALITPYISKHIKRNANYKFLLTWVLLSVLLLSVIPEKKERYVLPALIPLALLAAYYVHLLFCSSFNGKWNYRIILSNTVLCALAAFALPVALYFFAYKPGILSATAFTLFCCLFSLIGGWLLYLTRNASMGGVILTMLVLHTTVIVVGLPLYNRIHYPATNYKSLKNIRSIKPIAKMPFYALDGMPPAYVWEVGKPVDTLRIRNSQLQLPDSLPAVVFSAQPLHPNILPLSNLQLQQLDAYNYSKQDPEKVYYVSIISRKPALARHKAKTGVQLTSGMNR